MSVIQSSSTHVFVNGADRTGALRKPIPVQGDLRNLPDALAPLKASASWVVWRYVWKPDPKKDHGGDWSKPPFQAKAPGCHAKNNDPTTWSTYEDAVLAYEASQCDGIGFNVLNSGLVVLDLDDCRDPITGKIEPEAMAIVHRAASYCEVSPSGEGLRVIGVGGEKNLHRKFKLPNSVVSVEVYRNCQRYFTVTGAVLKKGSFPPGLGNLDRLADDLVAELSPEAKPEPAKIISLEAARGKSDSPNDLPQDLQRLISNPPEGDLSAHFFHCVNWLGDNGYNVDQIEGLIAGQPIVPERYANRLREQIETCLSRGRPKQDNGAGTTAPRQASEERRLILSSAAFIAGFVPPDYLIDGLVQRRFIYSLTAPTGTGKTAVALLLCASVALGRPIAEYPVEQGRVLYLAGENPDDVRMRWLAMAQAMGFDIETIPVHFLPGVFKLSEIAQQIATEVERIGPVALIVVDTSAAYFEGSEENANVEMGIHARRLRNLVTMPGGPCVLVCCHPVKNAGPDNLLPRGGGAFVAEMDGNLTLSKTDAVVTLHTQGKFRGPDFTPVSFMLASTTAERLKDSKGRSLPTVIAKAISEAEKSNAEANTRSDEDTLLLAIAASERTSLNGLADTLRWHRSKVQRCVARLKKGKYLNAERGSLTLTDKGKKEAQTAKLNRELAGKLG